MPTIQQLAITMNRDIADTLRRNALAVPEDKLTWKPLDTGRSVLSQIAECAVVTGFTAHILNSRVMPPFDNEAYAQQTGALDTLDKALAALHASSEALVAAIEAFPTEELDTKISLPWFPEPQPFAQVMFVCYWNNLYHVGQVSYIQTLYGDTEMH